MRRLFAFIFFIASGCAKDDADGISPSQASSSRIGTMNLFPGTELINVPKYDLYDINGKYYQIRGDLSGTNDTLPPVGGVRNVIPKRIDVFPPPDPVFQWQLRESGYDDYIAVGIFDTLPTNNRAHIKYPKDLIWYWHIGMGAANPGEVPYSEGRPFEDGEVQYDKPAKPLQPGHEYYWAVWTWDEKGYKVNSSSKANKFKAEE